MAANMPMAAGGQMMMMQQQHQQHSQLQAMVYAQLANSVSSVPNGWQNNLPLPDRLGRTMNLISNTILALPSADWQKAASFGLELEKKAYQASPDRQTYENIMQSKITEMVKRRQANAPDLQNQLNADAARQAQLQAQQQQQQQKAAQQAAQQQQQQLMLNQMAARGISQPTQSGLNHLQMQMQASPIPQQQQTPQQQQQTPQQQPLGMGMVNPGMPQNRPDQQRPFGMPMAQPRPQQDGIHQLSPQDRAKVLEAATKLYQAAPEGQKLHIRQAVQSKLSQAQLLEYQNSNRDPAMLYFQNQAVFAMRQQMQARMAQNRPGMPQNGQQQPHPGQINPALANTMGSQPTSDGPLFAPNLETIRPEQQLGLMGQQPQPGHVGPPGSGPGRNPTPGALAGVPAQHTPAGQQGSGPTPRPPIQQQQSFLPPGKMEAMAQAHAQQARVAAANRTLGVQAGGIGGQPPNSQGPAMTTLNAPMRPPVSMGGAPGQAMGQANPQLAAGVGGQFNHQPNGRPTGMSGSLNPATNPNMARMLQAMTPEARAQLATMPEHKLQEMLAKWSANSAQINRFPAPGQPGMPGMFGMTGPPQPGPTNAVQFLMGNNPGQPVGVVGNTPAMMQQQQRQQQMLNQSRMMFQNPAQNPQSRMVMDSLDVPPNVLQQLGVSGSPEIRKWNQLKHYLQQNNIPPQVTNQLLSLQVQQFKVYMENKQMAARQQNGGPQMPMQGGQQPQNVGVQQRLQQPQQTPPLPPGVNYPAHVYQISQAELENVRANIFRTTEVTPERLMAATRRLKEDNWRKKYWLQHSNGAGLTEQNAPAQVTAAPAPQAPQTTAPTTPAVRPPGPQPAANVPVPEAPAQAAPVPQKNARPPPQTRPPPPNPSPATVQKNLKRPNSDDAPDSSAQSANGAPKPAAQPDGRPTGPVQRAQANHPTPEQIARLPLEQRLKVQSRMAQNRVRAMVTEEDQLYVHKIEAEVRAAFEQQAPDRPIIMNQTEMAEAVGRLIPAGRIAAGFGAILPAWYHVTKDDARLKMFLKTRMRVARQYQDAALQQPKNVLTMSRLEIDQFINLAETINKDVVTAGNNLQSMTPSGTEQAHQVTPQQQPVAAQHQQPPQAAPSVANNAEKQPQGPKQVQNRASGKPGQAPAAPTTTQPPFPFNVQKSPAGEPTYFNTPPVTQQNLNPPPKKKPRTGAAPASSPAVQPRAGASPQTKVPSPEIQRQPAPEPAKPAPKTYPCPEPDCEMHTMGFPTEEARNAHHQEDHVKAKEDPMRFVHENLAISLGLDADGNPKAGSRALDHEAGSASAPPMGVSLSRQGQTPTSKPDFAATPMSRDASMRRQASAAGGKAENTPTPGRNAVVKAETTPLLAENKLPGGKQEADASQQFLLPDDAWATSTIDPQSLFSNFTSLDSMAGNMLADFSAYRSSTPNDTPESSKDSGASEPNSDISEGMQLDIDLNWQPMDPDMLLDMNNFTVGGLEGLDGEFMGAESYQFNMDDMSSDFSKPFQLDTSLYSMDTN